MPTESCASWALLLATSSFAFAITTYAQTQGSERRDERRDTRSGSRAVKQACKAGDQKRSQFSALALLSDAASDRRHFSFVQ